MAIIDTLQERIYELKPKKPDKDKYVKFRIF